MESFRYKDVSVEWDEMRLVFGNSRFRRTMMLAEGFPRTVSLRDAQGREFADAGKSGADCHFIGINRPGYREARYEWRSISVRAVEEVDFDSPHVLVEMIFAEPVQEVVFRREFFIYPGLAAHAVRNHLTSAVMPNCYWTFRSELRGEENRSRFAAEHLESCVDSLRPAAGLHPVESVEFAGRTDYTDELVLPHPLSGGDGCCRGNLLRVEAEDGAGLLWVQEAPPSAERRDLEEHDFRFAGGEVFSCCWGVPPGEIRPGREFSGYRNAVLLYHDPAERAAGLKDYLRLRFPMREEEQTVMVNPWGCGRFPELTGEAFLLREIAAAAECGADQYQVDDSWQEGGSLSELLQRNRHIGRDFWSVSKARLGGSFKQLTAAAEAAGIQLALWVAPNGNQEYRDWREFAELLLEYHRRDGFAMFKIDGVVVRTLEAEENLEALLRTVRRESGGAVYFNLDTTNGQRPGYFRFLEYGNIFLENRYVGLTWSIGYHPEKTLRSFWQLSRYLRAQSLQIEIPAPEDVNPELYQRIGYDRADVYPFEYWVAIALFGCPLVWMAPSLVRPETRAVLRRMFQLRRQHRAGLFHCRIFPVGAPPDGSAITGFYADSGYLIVFREAGCATDTAELAGDFAAPAWKRAELLAGVGSVSTGTAGFRVELPEAASFAFFRLLP